MRWLPALVILALAGACSPPPEPSAPSGASAETARDQALLDELAEAGPARAEDIEQELVTVWSTADDPAVEYLMARAAEALGKNDRPLAREMYDRAILIAPDHAQAWLMRAQLQYEADNLSAAMSDLGEVLAIEPRHFMAWVGLARMFEQIGADDPAMQAYEAALAVHPHYAAARQGRARLVHARGERSL